MDFKDLPQFRPAEIKTYHSSTYDRISPSTTKFDAKGKTVLITAGATGIGYSISESFAKAGVARIIILQRRESVLATAKEALEKAYPNTKVETYSASQSDSQRMTEIIQSVGEIDVLIPCATYAGDMKPPTKDKNTEQLAEVYMVNVVGLFHMVREFLALPATASGGPKSVIHVSSNASQMCFPGGSGYCSSKAAANQIITHFAFDDPNGNVKFYSLHPGAVWTALAEENVPQSAVVWEDIKLPGDFAVWLAGPEATFLNGRFVWAAWDVDELIAMMERLASDSNLLTITLAK
ncbi:hypothetical protein LTR17_005398 [Elasticomyces elasticus]|nr:hypothetical protein LTR17_005398 [Elasticomyces elasticus]